MNAKSEWKAVWSYYRGCQRKMWAQLMYMTCGDDDALLDSWSDAQILWYQKHPALRVAANRHILDHLSLK